MGGYPEGYPVDHQPREMGVAQYEEEWVTKDIEKETTDEIQKSRHEYSEAGEQAFDY